MDGLCLRICPMTGRSSVVDAGTEETRWNLKSCKNFGKKVSEKGSIGLHFRAITGVWVFLAMWVLSWTSETKNSGVWSRTHFSSRCLVFLFSEWGEISHDPHRFLTSAVRWTLFTRKRCAFAAHVCVNVKQRVNLNGSRCLGCTCVWSPYSASHDDVLLFAFAFFVVIYFLSKTIYVRLARVVMVYYSWTQRWGVPFKRTAPRFFASEHINIHSEQVSSVKAVSKALTFFHSKLKIGRCHVMEFKYA